MNDLAALVAGGRDHHRDVQPGVACEQRFGEGCFQQDLVLGADMSGQHFPADLLGQRVHLTAAGLLLPLVYLRRKIISRGAAAAGVGEHMDLQEADLLEEGTAFLKVSLGLTGEAADAVGGKADRALPIGGADLIHHLGVLLRGVDPAHPAQGGGAAALQAEVELGAELFHRCQPGDELRGQHVGVQAAQTDPLDALHLSAFFHQLHQIGPGVQTVAGQGNGAEHDLAVAGGGQLAQLLQDAVLGAAAHRAAGAGDDAVGTLTVAAVLHLDKRAGVGLEPLHGQLLKQLAPLVGRNGNDTLVAVQQLEHIVQDGLAVSVAADEISLHELGSFLGESLRIAAGEHGHGTGIFALGAAQPLAALLVAEVGHGAAVHHKNIRFFALRHDGEASAPEHLLQRAGLVQVDLAAKGIKTNSHKDPLR